MYFNFKGYAGDIRLHVVQRPLGASLFYRISLSYLNSLNTTTVYI